MPKKAKSKKNRKNKKNMGEFKRNITYPSEMGQEYGFVTKALGCRFFDVDCLDGKKRRCIVRTRRMRIKLNAYVIVSLRDFDDKTGDIIHVYNDEEVSQLKKEGKIVQNIVEDEADDDNFDFEFEDI